MSRKNATGRGNRVLALFGFMLRFLVLAPILVSLWWELIPYYGWLLAQIAGGLAHFVFGVPILAVGVILEPETWMNTGTKVFFQIPQADRPFSQPTMDIALLVTNLAPYWALVLATAGLTLRRRALVLFYGSAFIVAGHIFFITVLLRFQDAVKGHAEIATSAVQFFLVLPFLLWIWFVYRDTLAEYLTEQDAPHDPAAKS